MNHRGAFCVLLLSGFAAACGGGQPEATQPSNPPAASAEADAAPAPAPSASAAAVDAAAPVASAAPAASAAPSGPPGQPGPGEWDSWSHDQKLEYMKTTVMPKSAELFHDFDAKKYAETKCVLCHGAGVKDGSFKMPNPALPKLDLSEAGFKKLKATKPKVLDFMVKLEQQTAGLLGEQPYDPATQKGFGCMECHTKVAEKATKAKADKPEKTEKAGDKPEKTEKADKGDKADKKQ